MKNTTNKVVVIGAGSVGMSFLYAAINQNLTKHYGIIDLNNELAYGQKLDLEDGRGTTATDYIVESGGYELLNDADLLVITAGTTRKVGEEIPDLTKNNVKIMKSIAVQVKANGFNGITIIVASPVDVLATIYQKITQFKPQKIISSSCVLDVSRLKLELSKVIEDTSPKDFEIYVIGEHGILSAPIFSLATLNGIKLSTLYDKYNLDDEKLDKIFAEVRKKADKINKRKGATYYGIGMNVVDIAKAVLRDEKRILATGALLSGEFEIEGFYVSIPCLIGKEGIIRTFELELSKKEKIQFSNSISALKKTTLNALEIIKN